ncbi:hypothetical protein F4679DRAFT_556785 [Xylaria curta]|nr:hypothetical protein F4679DRAFT_556785 [Xylaria curta]
MPNLTSTNRQGYLSYLLMAMQVMTIGEHQSWAHTDRYAALANSCHRLISAGIRRAPCYTQRALIWGTIILYQFCRVLVLPLPLGTVFFYQVHGVLALPIPSEGSTDIAMKSYELAQTSYKVMVAMGFIMIALALIHSAITIAQFCLKRCVELPRNPVICEISAAAHAALGQPVSNDNPAPDSGHELPSLASETIAFAYSDNTGSSQSGLPQQSAPMPAERPSRGTSASAT